MHQVNGGNEMQGTVKWYNRAKGYGFITGEDGQEYFIHYSQIPQGTFIRENDLVSFDPVDAEKGKQAQNLQLTQKGSERTDLPAEEAATEEAPEASEESAEDAPAEETAEAPAEEDSEEPKDSTEF